MDFGGGYVWNFRHFHFLLPWQSAHSGFQALCNTLEDGPEFNVGFTNVSPEQWSKMRISLKGLGTLKEIETYWSINDYADANEVLDIKEDAEAFHSNAAKRKSKKRK